MNASVSFVLGSVEEGPLIQHYSVEFREVVYNLCMPIYMRILVQVEIQSGLEPTYGGGFAIPDSKLHWECPQGSKV